MLHNIQVIILKIIPWVQKKYDAIPLTEEDFKEFPILASIIRDKSQKPDYGSSYRVDFWIDGYSAFTYHFSLFGCLEYQKKRYNFNFMQVD